jgi:L-iditol 2-dehydrogenase
LAAVFDYVRIGGRITFVGISIGRKIPAELGKIQGKSLTIKGTIGSPGVWPAALRFLERTKLDLSPIQTHFFDLTKGIEAFEFGKNPKECIKITLTNEA